MRPSVLAASVLDPASEPAREIAALWWWMLALGTAVLAIVLVALALALRARGREDEPERGERRGRRLVVGGGIVLPVVVLVPLLVLTLRPGGPIEAVEPAGEDPLVIEVVGHQWWWELRYPGGLAVTANELHIPVGRPVTLELRSADVIHSLWVPELNGKVDLVPGKPNRMQLTAERPGRYAGACAEFCGVQHAKMELFVVAQPPERFEQWLARIATPAREPRTALERRGRQAFVEGTCAACHAIRGTRADGELGPDLTHFALRETIGAGAVPNTRGHLGGWIVDSQSIKPGNKMPPLTVGSAELQALLAYLESLE